MGGLMQTVYRETEDRHSDYGRATFAIGPIDENGVTYRAFSFRVSFPVDSELSVRWDRERAERHGNTYVPRIRGAFVSETNGSGTRHYRLEGSFVDTIWQLANADEAACFHLLMGLVRCSTETFSEGRADGIDYLARAAAQGRLKTRKVRGENTTKVAVRHSHIPKFDEWDGYFPTAIPDPPAEGVHRIGSIEIGGGA